MSAAIGDERGVIVDECPSCHQKNRLAFSRLRETTRCGRCKTELAAVVGAGRSRPRRLNSTASSPAVDPRCRRLLGAVVRPCRMVAPGDREGRGASGRQAARREGEHRRGRGLGIAARHPLDSDDGRLQARPRGRANGRRAPGAPTSKRSSRTPSLHADGFPGGDGEPYGLVAGTDRPAARNTKIK